MDFSKLPERDRAAMMQLIEEKQAKQYMNLFSYVVDNCFKDCILEFTSKKISEKEENCARNCTDKILKLTNRVGLRMNEKNMSMTGAGAFPDAPTPA